MRFHPYSEQYPPMSDVELAALAADLAERGQLQPGLTFRGELADGRNRYRAWVEILARAVEDFWTLEYEGPEADLIAHLDALNLRRRQLSAGQRACLAVLRMEVIRQLRKTCPKMGKFSRADAAREFSVSTGYIADASSVRNAYPLMFHKAFLGEIELAEAYRWTRDQKGVTRRDTRPENDETEVTGTGSPPDGEPDADANSADDAGEPVEASREELDGGRERPDREPPPERAKRGFSRRARCPADPSDDLGEIAVRVDVFSPVELDTYCPLCQQPHKEAGEMTEAIYEIFCATKDLTVRVTTKPATVPVYCPLCRGDLEADKEKHQVKRET